VPLTTGACTSLTAPNAALNLSIEQEKHGQQQQQCFIAQVCQLTWHVSVMVNIIANFQCDSLDSLKISREVPETLRPRKARHSSSSSSIYDEQEPYASQSSHIATKCQSARGALPFLWYQTQYQMVHVAR